MLIELIVRDLGQEDILAFYELVCDIYESTDAMSEAVEEKYPSREAFQLEMEGFSKRPGALLLVAEGGEQLLGYIMVKPRAQLKLSHTAELSMGVRSRARGLGAGTRLLDEAVSRLRRDGLIEILYLMVRADNGAAVRLYEKAGFERLAVLDNDTKIGERYYSGLLMRKFLKERFGV